MLEACMQQHISIMKGSWREACQLCYMLDAIPMRHPRGNLLLSQCISEHSAWRAPETLIKSGPDHYAGTPPLWMQSGIWMIRSQWCTFLQPCQPRSCMASPPRSCTPPGGWRWSGRCAVSSSMKAARKCACQCPRAFVSKAALRLRAASRATPCYPLTQRPSLQLIIGAFFAPLRKPAAAQAWVVRTSALRRMFVSVKGFYFQAEVVGQPVTWLVPHALSQVCVKPLIHLCLPWIDSLPAASVCPDPAC